ncbi:hypothetical protein GQ600_14954 [Phytophthora cactorum]|nr:hypothetical protein GQ600_14954 [Phytophthora cactorum]
MENETTGPVSKAIPVPLRAGETLQQYTRELKRMRRWCRCVIIQSILVLLCLQTSGYMRHYNGRAEGSFAEARYEGTLSIYGPMPGNANKRLRHSESLRYDRGRSSSQLTSPLRVSSRSSDATHTNSTMRSRDNGLQRHQFFPVQSEFGTYNSLKSPAHLPLHDAYDKMGPIPPVLGVDRSKRTSKVDTPSTGKTQTFKHILRLPPWAAHLIKKVQDLQNQVDQLQQEVKTLRGSHKLRFLLVNNPVQVSKSHNVWTRTIRN